MKWFRLALFLFVCGVTFFPKSSYAIGVGANPSSIQLEFQNLESKSVDLIVFNISDEGGSFRVYADDLSDWFVIGEAEFDLGPQEHRTVHIVVSPKEKRTIATNISIVAEPINKRGFTAFSGIKVPITLQMQFPSSEPKSFSHTYLVAAIACLGIGLILLLFFVRYLAKRRTEDAEGHMIEDVNLALHDQKLWWKLWKKK